MKPRFCLLFGSALALSLAGAGVAAPVSPWLDRTRTPEARADALMLPRWEGVMRASGRLIDAGFPIGWGVGRHGPGDNVFAYFVDPFGIVVEHTAEVLQVDAHYRVRGPDEWTWAPGRTDQWGIAPPKSEACKKAQLAIPFEERHA